MFGRRISSPPLVVICRPPLLPPPPPPSLPSSGPLPLPCYPYVPLSFSRPPPPKPPSTISTKQRIRVVASFLSVLAVEALVSLWQSPQKEQANIVLQQVIDSQNHHKELMRELKTAHLRHKEMMEVLKRIVSQGQAPDALVKAVVPSDGNVLASEGHVPSSSSDDKSSESESGEDEDKIVKEESASNAPTPADTLPGK